MIIALGTPSTRPFSAQYVSALWNTRIKADGVAWLPVIGQAIDIGRNVVCKRALAANADFLLMHDSDATWHPDAVMRLIERNLPVVTGVIFKRELPTIPTIGKYVSVSTDGSVTYSFADCVNTILAKVERENVTPDTKNELLFDKQPDDLQEIDACGAHFVLIRRDVLQAVGDPWFACTSVNGGEDFDFCRKAIKAGFKLYADYSVFTGHVVGDGVEIGLREFLMFRDKMKAETTWLA